MKVITLISLLALPSLAVGIMWPAEHTTCLNANNPQSLEPTCESGKSFYVDEVGRCGCLSPDEFAPPSLCETPMPCEAGLTWSSLYRARQMCGQVLEGCGCFGSGEVNITSEGDVH
jgi:hypothetical protein